MELMERWFQALSAGGYDNMQFIKNYTVTESWENDTKGKLIPIYNAVIGNDLTFNDGKKICLMVMTGNTASSYRCNAIFMSMAAPPDASNNNLNAGGIIRQDWVGPRSMNTATSAWVSAGTVIKVYVITIPT